MEVVKIVLVRDLKAYKIHDSYCNLYGIVNYDNCGRIKNLTLFSNFWSVCEKCKYMKLDLKKGLMLKWK